MDRDKIESAVVLVWNVIVRHASSPQPVEVVGNRGTGPGLGGANIPLSGHGLDLYYFCDLT